MDRTGKIAGERGYRNRFSKTHRGVLDDPARIDRVGVLGEQAFARYMGLPDDAITARGPVSSNFVLDDGTRVDVRSSDRPFCRLLVPPSILIRGTVDVFVLAEVQAWKKPGTGKVPVVDATSVLFPETDRPQYVVSLRGWATPEDVVTVEAAKISDRPDATEVHALPPYLLRPMEELRKHHIPYTKSLFDGLEGL